MIFKSKTKPVTTARPKSKGDEQQRCKNLDDYYGDMICKCNGRGS